MAMHLRRRQFFNQKKFIFGALVLVAAFYCEWFVYAIQPMFWPDLRCRQDEICTKILFIADPQIQGELAAPSPFNHLFIYDSDQYLKTTFSVVTNHFEPDVLVYLGDIMDEGSVATKDQYQNYVKRIKNIFARTYVPAVEVWVPGDNDIGGEMEPIRKDKIEAFEQEFQIPSVIRWRNISFYKVNAITNNFPKLEDNSTDLYKIVISHYSVTKNYNLRTQVINEIRPNIFFCAHSHDSKFVMNAKDFSKRLIYRLLPEKDLHKGAKVCNENGNICPGQGLLQILPNNEAVYEIYVPTCSYRMGTSEIGYGAAVYEHNNRTLKYTVFWSPQRFPYLFIYLALLIIVIMWAVVYAARLCKRCMLKKSSAARRIASHF